MFWIQLVVGVALSSFSLSAETLPNHEDRILDLEAKLEVMKSEVAATKELANQEWPSALNPSISVIGDVMGQVGFGMKHDHHHDDAAHADHDHDHDHAQAHDHHHHEFHNGVMVRNVEFEFRGSVDPYADALVVVALEPHDSHGVDVHLEEAFARLKKWPYLGYSPFGISLKAGKFKTAFGRMNRIHLHNIPQIDYPLALKTFLGKEGYAAPGVSLNTGFNPSPSTAVNVFLESVFLSRLPIQEKEAEKMPSGIGHIWLHQGLGESHAVDLGVSSLVGRKGKKKSGALWLVGGDVHYSYIPNSATPNPFFLIGNEFFAANVTKDTKRWPMGNFTWAQINLFATTYLGVRYDVAPHEDKLAKMQHALGGYLSHYTSEFLRFRLGYEHVMPKFASFHGDHRVMLNMIFILGSHPSEPYFVNR